jgi:hypothetical protein
MGGTFCNPHTAWWCVLSQHALLCQCCVTGELLEMGKPPSPDLDAQLVDSSGLKAIIVHANDVAKWRQVLQGRRPIEVLGA